jgi:hypothetical protein
MLCNPKVYHRFHKNHHCSLPEPDEPIQSPPHNLRFILILFLTQVSKVSLPFILHDFMKEI